MYGRIKADNFFYTTIASSIDDNDVVGSFSISQKTVNGYTIEDGDYIFRMIVGLNSPSTAEVFRITKVAGTTLTFDKRISPTGKVNHPIGDLCNMQASADFINYISNNITDFGYVETVEGVGNELKVKVYGGRIENPSGPDINIADTILSLSNNSTNYIYFDEDSNTFNVSSSEPNAYKLLAYVVTGATSITSVSDYRAAKATLGATPISLSTVDRLALSNVRNGMFVYDINLGETYQYIGGSRNPIASGSTQPNATEVIAGKVQKATDAQVDNEDETGNTGAFLFATPKQIAFSKKKSLTYKKQSSVITPSTGESTTYIDSTDNKFKIKQSDGSIDVLLTSVELDEKKSSLTNSDYLAGEDISKGNSLFVEIGPTFSQAGNKEDIGNVTGSTKISFPFIGSGVTGDSLNLSLCVTGNPSADLIVRLETDNVGVPSGILLHANATATITAASLTTSLADTVVTLIGNVSPVLGVKYHIVLSQAGNTVNGSNYYSVGYSLNNTSTRGINKYNGASRGGPLLYDTFQGASIDINKWNSIVGGLSVNNALKRNVSGAFSSNEGDNYVTSLNTYSGFVGFKRSSIISGYAAGYMFGGGLFVSGRLYRDDNNYIEITSYDNSINTGWTNKNISLKVVSSGVTQYTTTLGSSSTDFKIEYNPSSGDINMFHRTSSWQQVGTTQNNIFTGNPRIYIGCYGRCNSYMFNGSSISTNNVVVTSSTFTEQTPLFFAGLFAYVNSPLAINKLLSKTSASYSYKLPAMVRLSTDNFNTGQVVKYDFKGISKIYSSLNDGQIYYISNSAGEISPTPGSYGYAIGTCINKDLYLNSPFGEAPEDTFEVTGYATTNYSSSFLCDKETDYLIALQSSNGRYGDSAWAGFQSSVDGINRYTNEHVSIEMGTNNKYFVLRAIPGLYYRGYAGSTSGYGGGSVNLLKSKYL